MSNLSRAAKNPALHILLGVFFAGAFTWPFITDGGPLRVVGLLFATWACSIVVLFLLSRAPDVDVEDETDWEAKVFSAAELIVAILVYVGILFGVAQLSERRSAKGSKWVQHPAIYSLVLAVYCTTWTYYGSVGKAANDGMLFLTIYLGPTLAMIFGAGLMRKMVRIKNTHRITSIADFMSARYGKSQLVAAIATLMLTVGIVPYLALQLKAVTGTFTLLTHSSESTASTGYLVSPIVVGLLIAFTIAFGIRRLDPTERHPGMVVSLATESLVKLAAFIAAGVFVLGLAFGGVGGFVDAMNEGLPKPLGFMGKASGDQLLTWGTYLVLAMSAFAMLPRQFHVGIIENPNDNHVRTAMWLTPLYLLLINVFVVPIAIGGLVTMPAGSSADEFVVSIPMQAGKHWLSLFVFMGGFSAAIGMIMVETMTMSTMISNHLMLPVIEVWPSLRFLRRYLLYSRWIAAAIFILTSYAFEIGIGKSYMLVSIGMLSFAAVLQFAPIIVGGLLWRGANRAGAILGLSVGFVTWFYTLLMPTFVKSGWMDPSILKAGPLGIALLKPEALFGLSGLPSLAHGTLWTMVLNIGFYVGGSVLFRTGEDERRVTEEFLGGRLDSFEAKEEKATIEVAEKVQKLEGLLLNYHGKKEAAAILETCVKDAGIGEKEMMNVVELAELHSRVERALAGSIGAAAAHAAMRQGDHISSKESRSLAAVYGRMLAELHVSPSEFRKRIDYHHEREGLLTQQARELETRVEERTHQLRDANQKLTGEVTAKEKAQAKLIELHNELLETALRAGKAEIATNVLHNVGNVLNSINVTAELCTKAVNESRVQNLPKLATMLKEHEKDLGTFLTKDPKGKQVPVYIEKLAEHLTKEHVTLKEELTTLGKNVEHIKTIIALQQSHAGNAILSEVVLLQELMEDALKINALSFERHKIKIVRQYEELGPVNVQKHKVLQILINLLSNAKHALKEVEGESTLTLRIRSAGRDRVRLEFADNGVGISPGDLTRIFQHGFTTKKDGHGFGLHSGALAATQMGGSLTAHSEGIGKGATFVLELQCEASLDAVG